MRQSNCFDITIVIRISNGNNVSLPSAHLLTYVVICLFFRNRAQRSVPLRLVRGRVYYMEALMKEGGGADHISVGIKMRRKIVPVPKKYLFLVPPVRRYRRPRFGKQVQIM